MAFLLLHNYTDFIVIRLKIQLNNCRFDFKIKQGKLKRLQETTNHF